MTFKPTRLLIALAAAAIVAAPSFAQNVAVVNGKAIPMSREDAIVKQVVARGQQPDSKQLRDEIKQDLIAHEVLFQEAVKQGADKSPEAKTAMDEARQDIILNAFVQDFVAKHKPTDAEMKAAYDQAVKQHGDKEYHVRHILLENEADAKAAIAKIKGGAKFEDVAKASSKDEGSAGNGGDLDWAAPGALPPEFAAAVTALGKGAVTETPVKTQAGYHVIKVEDVRAAKVPSFEEAKPQLGRQVIQRKLADYEEEVQKKSKVTEKSISDARVNEVVKAQVAQGKATDTPAVREQVRKALVGREVMFQEAEKQGFGTKPEVKSALDQARQSIAINAMVAAWVKKHPVSDADLKAEYDKYKAHMGDKEYHARHILVPTEDEAKKIIAKIKGGAKFEDLAKAESKDGSAANGGDLDWASPANYVPEFSKAMVALQKGQVTDTPVKSQFGFHVIKLEDVRATTYPPLEQVKGEFEKQIQNQRLTAYRDDLMKKAKIQ